MKKMKKTLNTLIEFGKVTLIATLVTVFGALALEYAVTKMHTALGCKGCDWEYCPNRAAK